MQMLGWNFTPALSTVEVQSNWLQNAGELWLQLKSSEFGGAMYYLESSLFPTSCHFALLTSVCPAFSSLHRFLSLLHSALCSSLFLSFVCSCLHPPSLQGKLLGCADPQEMERPWLNLSFPRMLLLQPLVLEAFP